MGTHLNPHSEAISMTYVEIREGINQIVFLFLDENICGYSLEVPTY